MNWSLIVGPGARIAELKAFLLPEPCDGARVELADLGELGELLEIHGGSGKLLLSADEIETEDVGLLRHWLRRELGYELVLCGADPSRRPVRALLAEPRARWLHWAPDIDDLRGLMRPPASLAEHAASRGASAHDEDEGSGLEPMELTPAPRRAPAQAGSAGSATTELERIEAILGAPGAPESASAERSATSTRSGDSTRSARARPTREDDAYERAAERARRSTPFAPRDAPAAEPSSADEGDDAQHPGRRVLAPHPRQPPEEIFGRALEAQAPAREAPSAPERAPAPQSAPASPSIAAAPASAAPPERPAARAGSAPRDGTTLPAPYFRDQVADLADMAQRIELDLAGLRDGVLDSGLDDAALEPALEHLTQDVARLLQFTRTLGYLVAPPPSGNQSFDLGELVELFVSTAPAKGDGPRFLLRKDGPARVTSDRQLLSQALDAFFFVARSSARPGEVVRVHLRLAGEAANAPGSAMTELGIEFPSGALAGLDPARIVEPYALRRTFPELGANALLAASGIVRGQGGEVELARVGEGHLEWRVRLPLAGTRAPSAPQVPPMNRPPVRADDPFA